MEGFVDRSDVPALYALFVDQKELDVIRDCLGERDRWISKVAQNPDFVKEWPDCVESCVKESRLICSMLEELNRVSSLDIPVFLKPQAD